MKRFLLCLTVLYGTAYAVPTQVFVPNKGQIADTKGGLHPEILFKHEGEGLNLYFQKDRLVYHFISQQDKPQSEYTAQDHENLRNGNLNAIGKKVYFHRMDLVFQGANANVEVLSDEKARTYSNYYLGHCPNGIMNVEHYGRLVYKNIYQGIDLAFYFTNGKLKYDFIVSPGADASQIKLSYEGAESIEELSSGEIRVKTPVSTLTEGLPYTYDKESGKEIPSKYILNGTSISFDLGENQTLNTTVIDPTVTWATFFNNGNSSDTWTKPTYDAAGAFYNAGYTYYTAYPLINAGGGQFFDNTKDGITDLVVVKFSAANAYTWSTYYGGDGGDYLAGYTDYGKALAVDASNNVYFAGSTDGTTFPTQNLAGSFFQDQTKIFSETSFFVKLNSAGVRQWASMYQHEAANTMSGGIRVNGICTGNGKLYFTGQTYRFNSNDIPLRTLAGAYNNATFKGPQDVFIGRFDCSTEVLEWSSYLNDAGSVTASYRQGCDLQWDNGGLWFVGRHTTNTSNAGHPLLNPGGGAYFQGTNAGDQDLIITKFSTSLTIAYSTYYGGNNQDIPSHINCNAMGDAAIVLRAVRSSNFPTFDPGGGAYYQAAKAATGTNSDAAIIKFSTAGIRQWATYYGGNAGESFFTGVGFDNSSNIYVFGYTGASNFPTQTLAGSFNDNTLGGTFDVTLLKFNSSHVCQWSTFYGGTAVENIYSPKGEVYSNGCSVKLLTFPYTNSSDFPTTNPGGGAFFEGTASTTNVNTILLMEETGGGLSTAPTAASATATTICSGSSTTLSFTGGSLGTGASYQWYSGSCGGTSVGSGTSISVSPTTTTTYFVRAEGTCNTTTCASVTITVNTASTAPTAANATATTICSGSSTTLSLTGGSLGTGASFQWYSGSCGGTAVGSGTSVSVSPASTTTYFVRAEGTCNTTACAQVTITVNTNSVAATSASAASPTICSGGSTTLTAVGGTLGTGANWQWYTGSCGGTAAGSGTSITVSPTTTTTYFVRAEGTCNTTTCQTVTVTVNTASVAPTSITPGSSAICAGGTTTLTVVGGSLGTGAGFNWYSGSCGGTFVGTGSPINVSPTVTTTYFVRAEGTCNTTTCASVTIVVNTASTAPTSASATATTICPGGSSTLSFTGGSLGTGASFNWYSGSCAAGTPEGTGTSITVSPTVTTTYFIRAEGPCGNTSCASVTVTVATLSVAPTSVSTTASTVCSGSSPTLSVVGGSLGTGANWQWYSGSCGGTLVGSGSSLAVSPTVTTTYFVRAEGLCNTTTCQSITITVDNPSTVPTSASATATTICTGSSTTLSVTGGTLGTGAAYQWYSGSCGGTLVGSGSSLSVSPTSTTTYFVRAEGPCNTTTCVSVTINVNTPSSAPASASATSTTICAGSSTTLSFLGGTLGTGASYQWYSGSCGGTPEGSGTSITVSPTITTTYFVRAEGACNTTACVSVTITVNTPSVAPTGITASATTLCTGNNVTLTANGGTPGTGATYEWYSGSCGGTPVGSGISITIPVTATTDYFVRLEGACNTTTCQSVTITAVPGNTLPTAINSSPSGAICPGTSVNLSFSTGTLATGASWHWYSGSCGGTAEGTGTSISVSPTSTTTYFVRAEGGTCGASACQSVTVNVNTVSTAPTSISPLSPTVCTGGSSTLTAIGGTLGTGATYQWYTGSCGGTPAGTGSFITVSPTVATTYFVNITGTCNTTICQQVTVTMQANNVAPTSVNASTTNLCAASSITLTQVGGSALAGAQFDWYEGSCGGTPVGTGASIAVNPTGATTYFVNVTGGCNTTTCAQVNITAAPVSAAWTPPTPGICVSAADVDLNTLLGSTPTTGTWFGPNVTGHTFDPTGLSGTVTLSYVLGSGACKDSVAHNITILAAPAAPVVSITPGSICAGSPVTINAPGTCNVYDAPTGGTLLGSTPLVVTPTTGTTYYVESVNASGCVNEGGRVSQSVTVFPSPTANAGPDVVACAGDAITLTATGGGVYSWSNGASTASTTVNPGGDIDYWVTVSSGGCSDTDTLHVNVITAGDVDANNDQVNITSGTVAPINVAFNDSGDPLTVTIVTGPTNGTAVVNSQGEIVYTPDEGFSGTEVITYSICDDVCGNACNTAQLIINVEFKPEDLNIPGGISPNGDGHNDVWHIKGLEQFPENEVVIFNRWGDNVFSAAPYLNDWHGQSNNTSLKLAGDEVVDGTYYYVLKLSPDEKEMNGPIEIIRNK